MTAASAKRTATTAGIAVGLALLIRAAIAARGGFYWDDLILIGRAGAHPLLSADFLLYDHDGHLMPAAFLLAGIATNIAPLNWALPVIQLVVLQALASLAVWRMLHVILGPRPAMLVPLGLYLFSPLTLPSFAWWANGLNQLPMQACMAFATAEAVLLCGPDGQRHGTRHAVAGTAALVVGLAFYEKAAVIPLVVFAAVALIARADGAPRPLRTAAKRGRRLWVPSMAVLAGWVVLYAAHGTPALRTDHLADAPEMVHHGFSLGLLPALVGGPWAWERWPPSPPWAAPPMALAAASWGLVAAFVIGSVLLKRRIGWVWPVVGAYVAASLAAMVLTRSGEETVFELGQTLRYVADSSVIVAIALAVILRAPRRSRGTVFLGGSARSRGTVFAAGILAAALFAAGSAWSTAAFDRAWRDDPTPAYLRTAKAALASHRDAQLLSQPVSIFVLMPVTAPYNRTDSVFGPLRRRPPFAEYTDALLSFDDAGHLVPGEITRTRTLLPGPVPGCGTLVGSGMPDGRIALDRPVLEWPWTAQINYLASEDGRIELALEGAGESDGAGPRPVTVPVREGPGTVFVRLHSGGDHLAVSAVTPGLSVCVGGGPMGALVPTSPASGP